MNRFKFLSQILVIFTIFPVRTTIAQVITIDDFNTDRSPVTVVNQNGPFPVKNTAVVPGGLGGEMNFVLELLDAPNTGDQASVEIANSMFRFMVDAGATGRVLMHWDGTDGSADTIQASNGLNDLDITNGSTQDGIEITVNSNLADIDLGLVFFTSPTDFSELTQTIPSINTVTKIKYRFDALQATGGNGADLTRCNAILAVLGVGGGVLGPIDLQLDGLATTPTDTTPPPVVLHDQLSPQAGTAIPSLNFPGDNPFDAQAADDFTVPAGHFYTLIGYEIVGRFKGPQPSNPTTGVFIYDDANGSPGQVACQWDAAPLISSGTDLWHVTTSSCELPEGTYWVSFQANVPVGTEFEIQENTQLFGNPYVWQNPGNGFGTGCTGWTAGSSCFGVEPSLAFRIEGTSKAADPNTIIVTNTNADGEGSLAKALEEASLLNSEETVTIKFNIPTSDPGFDPTTGRYTLKRTSGVFGGVLGGGTIVIDGTTQPGYQGKPIIVLDGENQVDTGILLGNASLDGTVRGLIFVNYREYGLHLIGSGHLIENCYFGTDGVSATQGNGTGIFFDVSGQNTVQDCIIGANKNDGIRMDDADQEFGHNNRIRRCAIGTDFGGMANFGNGMYGINIISGSGHVIGGGPGDGNVIKFNGEDGVLIQNGMKNTISAFGSGKNIIAQNGGSGAKVQSGASGTRIDQNLISGNTGLGIDLNGDGVTQNDGGDADTGGNNLQNFPTLTAAEIGQSNVAVSASLNSVPNSDFCINFFASIACDPSGFGEGEHFLGSDTVTTDISGNVAFETTLAHADSMGLFVTATATDTAGNTSEFSQCFDLANATSVADEEEPAVPTAFTLEQNYPNPFNPGTTIRFALPNASEVILKVYDLLGRKVATLVEGELQPGKHTVNFDARGLASGIYIYRLQADGVTRVRKLMLLK